MDNSSSSSQQRRAKTSWRKISLTRRLQFALVAMLLPLMGVAAAGVLGFRASIGALQEFQDEIVADSKRVDEVKDLMLEVEETAEEAFYEGDREMVLEFFAASRRVDGAFEGLTNMNRAEERRLAQSAEALWKESFALANKVLSGRAPNPDEIMGEAFHQPLDDATNTLADLNTVNGEQIAGEISSFRADARRQLWTALSILCLSSIAAALIAARLRSSITAPLLGLEEAAEEFGADNLSHRVRVQGDDELGRLGQAFNVMACKLQQSRDQLQHQALHDPLTGLANRALFMERMEQAVARARRRMTPVSVLFVDLDGFKAINDTLGHEAGDELLVAVGNRLAGSLRVEDTVGRLGGDEFGILLEETGPEGAAEAAERLVRVLKADLSLRAGEVSISVSIGVANRSADEETDELLRRADSAMYEAKARGKGLWQVFEPRLDTETTTSTTLRGELQRAVLRSEFVVHYQPIVDLQTGAPVALEALVRWDHPERGLLPPAEFIKTAEDSGHILYIDKWVLHEACRQVREWQRTIARGTRLSACVNLSARQLQHPGLAEEVAEALRAAGLAPEDLTLEITETVLVRDTEAAASELTCLKRLGVKLALDDFGTGYSSLSYLRRFPIDIIKIDRSFVSVMTMGGEHSELANALVKLGKSLRLDTVAEGIEKAGQLDALNSAACDMGQGYYFAKPLTAPEVEEFLTQRVPTPDARL